MSISLFKCGEQNLDEAHSSPGLHPAAGPGLAEECATLVSFCILLLDCCFDKADVLM
jgi:hypothetical protein